MNKRKLIAPLCLGLLIPVAQLLCAAEPVSAADAANTGKVSLNMRLRYEYANQDGLEASNAFTLRTRLGYQTPTYQNLLGYVEFEDITALGNPNNYNQAGLNPGGAGRTVIADPPTTELNQVYGQWSQDGTTVKVGRQVIILDNARFIGNVGWRQNEQSFDAATIRSVAIAHTQLTAGYIRRINRIFGYKNKGGRWYSDSYLLNAAYTGLPVGKVAAYAYRLKFSNAAAVSGDTVGAYLAGARPFGDGYKFNYRVEGAYQTDNGANPAGSSFGCDYGSVVLSVSVKPVTGGAGWELMGSDNGHAFQTPLATLHAFDGWADVFLSTPANGLVDKYVFVAGKLGGQVPWKLLYHHFTADKGGSTYGNEWDLVTGYALTKSLKFTAKFADFSGRGSFASRTKVWFQLDYAY